ncbi:MAG: RsmD family RNA methyltransferase [Lewinellaceae bacterium]|nr:RsmD family RNA methyltransferase [Saprospiraceae bacterium]MCB9337555.1 RsmD family RNA methyltransferase [Lewinellaceae bacterium]
MRIISGRFKGRRFSPPADKWPTRPTTDFAKEGLFNILQNTLDFEEIKVLDLFGGTGNHSYEFISRGCRQVTYVDKFPGCVKFVQKTATALGIEGFINIVQADVFKFVERPTGPYDYIFAGPPYPLPTIDLIPDLIFEKKLLSPGGWFVLEHNANHAFETHPRFLQQRNYGGTIFSFFEMPAPVQVDETESGGHP